MFIKYIDNGTSQCPVNMVYYTGVPQEILNQCIEVIAIPMAEVIEGKRAVLYCDPVEKTVFYGYEDLMVKVSQVDLTDIKSQNAQMLLALVQGGLL